MLPLLQILSICYLQTLGVCQSSGHSTSCHEFAHVPDYISKEQNWNQTLPFWERSHCTRLPCYGKCQQRPLLVTRTSHRVQTVQLVVSEDYFSLLSFILQAFLHQGRRNDLMLSRRQPNRDTMWGWQGLREREIHSVQKVQETVYKSQIKIR